MRDNEMIEEIAKIINIRCEAELGQVHANSKDGKVTKTVDTSLIAKDIYKYLTEKAVVITRKEYDDYQDLFKNFDDYLKLKDTINEKIASEIADYVAKTRKETAAVFAKKLENGIDNLDIILHEDNDEQYVSVNQLLEFIDEIAKQFSNEIKE